jgi:uncharacterized protein YbjT (DUF2867 family)
VEAQRILVTGATGYIGGRLVPRLLERGYRVRCLARDPRKLAGRWTEGEVEIARGDVLDPSSLDSALDGVDAAFYLVHAMGGGGAKFAERERDGARAFAQAAAERASNASCFWAAWDGAKTSPRRTCGAVTRPATCFAPVRSPSRNCARR